MFSVSWSSCGPHLARDCPDRNEPTGKGSHGSKDDMKDKTDNGRGKGHGVVTMATAFTASAKLEVEFVRSVARRRGSNESCDEHNPFDVYSPSEKLCSEKKRHPCQIRTSGVVI